MVTRNFYIFIVDNRREEEEEGRRGVKPNLDNCKVVEEPSQHENDGGATVGCFWDLHNIFQVLAKRPPLRSPGDLLRVAFSGLCVVLYANWIKNVTHFPKSTIHICPVASSKLASILLA